MKNQKGRSYLLILSLLFSINLFTNSLRVEVSFGEFLDKISILKIKSERISDEAKLKNIHTELDSLLVTYKEFIQPTNELKNLEVDLKKINEALWEIEDDIREKESNKAFDDGFIKLARSVYLTNDDRSRVKREINQLLGSRLIEEKSYKQY